MSIQWFPGHMAKARREIGEKLKLVDVVFELLDARIPLASRNPMIDEIVGAKPRLVLLTKSDLADPAGVSAWIRWFADKGLRAVDVDALHGDVGSKLVKEVRQLSEARRKSLEKRGIRQATVRVMILGVPNVGKSSLLNRLAERAAAATGDRPGVTKAQQWVRTKSGLELLDTPGILWPKFEDPMIGSLLAITGAIKSELFDPQDAALSLLGILEARYPQSLVERYKLSLPLQESEEVLRQIGAKRGALRKGGEVDADAVGSLILREFQTGKLGRVTLEWPETEDGLSSDPDHVVE